MSDESTLLWRVGNRAWLEGRTSKQISLGVGDRIVILDPRPVHENSIAYGGWAYGTTNGGGDGPSRGWFPLSFVRLDRREAGAHGWGGKGEGEGKRWTWPDRSAREKKVTFQVRYDVFAQHFLSRF